METIEYRDVHDKSDWGDGPWMTEPDKVQWRDAATGLPCLIVRGPSGALCGYVGLPEGHPLHGVGYDDAYEKTGIDVHGGLTFASECSHGADEAAGICPVPGDGDLDSVWWLGFDTAHGGDLTPRWHRQYGWGGDVYRTIDYVRADVESLAKQLHTMSA